MGCSLDRKAEDEPVKRRIRRKTVPGGGNYMCEVESLAGLGCSGQAGQQRPQVRGVMLKGGQEPGHSGLTDKLRNLNFLQSACGSHTSFIIRDDIIHLVFFLKVPLAPGLEGDWSGCGWRGSFPRQNTTKRRKLLIFRTELFLRLQQPTLRRLEPPLPILMEM